MPAAVPLSRARRRLTHSPLCPRLWLPSLSVRVSDYGRSPLAVDLRGLDTGLDVPFFLERGHLRGQTQRVEPQLAAPSPRVVQVLVFLVLHLFVGLGQGG